MYSLTRSLRTRLSTQKAGLNLGMNVIVFDINEGGWKLETELGVIMDGDKPEHIREAVPVIGSYCDIIGVRSFAKFENRDDDYEEKINSTVHRLFWSSRCELWKLQHAIHCNLCRPFNHRRI